MCSTGSTATTTAVVVVAQTALVRDVWAATECGRGRGGEEVKVQSDPVQIEMVSTGVDKHSGV